jgi:nitrite reductase (NADH) large subunit
MLIYELARYFLLNNRKTILNTKNQKNIVIVGNGMVGHHFCRQLAELDKNGFFKITVFGEEAWVAYDRVHISEHFAGKEFSELVLSDANWYAQRGIDLHTRDPIVAVDTELKTVSSKSGKMVAYDELVFATGSEAFMPNIEGLKNLPNILCYRTFNDLVRLRLASSGAKTAAVLGGGLLGLEAARACQQLGLKAHVLEMAQHLMPRQLDLGAAEMLARRISEMNIELHCNWITSKVESVENEVLLHSKDGQQLGVEVLVVAAGIRPRDEIAKAAGIDCNPRGGINIDNGMRTSRPNVYAIGECAFHDGKVYGLVAPGYKMSEELAKQLMGQPGEFRGMDLSTRLKLVGTDVVSIGQPFQPGDTVTYKSQEVYRRLTLLDGRLLGLVAIGSWEDLPEMQKRIDEGESIDNKELRAFTKTGLLPPSHAGLSGIMHWPDRTIICNCMNINKGQIIRACQGGCKSVDEVSRSTGAGTVCGTCRPQIARFLGQEEAFKVQDAGTRWIGWSALVSAVVLVLFMIIPGAKHSQSVLDPSYDLEIVWRDSFWKQVSGYGCVGLMLGSLGLTLRKRWSRFNWGNLQIWRAAHMGLIAVLYLVLYVHSGWRMGSHLNLALMLCFMITSVTGLGTAWAVWTESEANSLARRFRPNLLWIHIASFWPLPTLLFFHVFKFYYY